MIFAKMDMRELPYSCTECKMGERYGCVGDVKCKVLDEYFTNNVKPPYKERPDECPLREFAESVGAGCETRRRAVYEDALNTWGAEAQTKMLFEEIGELMQAVCKAGQVKNWEQRTKVWHNIAEEIADVSIMLGQMAVLFDVEDSVEKCKREKTARLMKRLEAAHNGEGAGE